MCYCTLEDSGVGGLQMVFQSLGRGKGWRCRYSLTRGWDPALDVGAPIRSTHFNTRRALTSL